MSAFEKITSKIAEKNAELEALKKKHMEELQGDFNEIIKLFFDECPRVQAVLWTQYTPYFNDGEECIFSVNEPYFVVEGFDREDLLDPYEYEDDDYKKLPVPTTSSWKEDIIRDKAAIANPTATDWAKKYYPECIAKFEELEVEYPGYGEKVKAFANLLSSNEDVLREVYGEHSVVYLTPTEVIVEEYSHD